MPNAAGYDRFTEAREECKNTSMYYIKVDKESSKIIDDVRSRPRKQTDPDWGPIRFAAKNGGITHG